MMISPSGYVEMLKDKTYPELIRERERLTEWIRKFEKDELAGDRSDPAWRMCPSPDVQYQMYLEKRETERAAEQGITGLPKDPPRKRGRKPKAISVQA